MSKKLSGKGKRFPKFKTTEEMVRFVEENDISDYINSKNFVPAHEVFEFEAKDATLTMRLPRPLLTAVKARAAKKRIPYQRYIRGLLENDVSRHTDR